MPEGFTEMFAQRLNESSAVAVKEAQSGDLLLAGRALICPGNRHMKVRRMEHGDIAVLVDQPRVNGDHLIYAWIERHCARRRSSSGS